MCSNPEPGLTVERTSSKSLQSAPNFLRRIHTFTLEHHSSQALTGQIFYLIRSLNNGPLPARIHPINRVFPLPSLLKKTHLLFKSPHSSPPAPYSSHTLVNVFMEPLPCCIPHSPSPNIQTQFPLSLSFIFVSSQSAHKIVDRPLSYPPCFHQLHHNSRLKNRKWVGIPDVSLYDRRRLRISAMVKGRGFWGWVFVLGRWMSGVGFLGGSCLYTFFWFGGRAFGFWGGCWLFCCALGRG